MPALAVAGKYQYDGSAQVLKENLVKLDRLPLVARVASLPEVPPETNIEVEISNIDLLELTFNAKFLHKQEA